VRPLPQRKRALEQRLGFVIAALALIERRKIGQFWRGIRAVEAAGLLHDRDGALVDRLGLGIAADFAIELGEIVERSGVIAAVRLRLLELGDCASAMASEYLPASLSAMTLPLRANRPPSARAPVDAEMPALSASDIKTINR
jgi:hypothetical protein